MLKQLPIFLLILLGRVSQAQLSENFDNCERGSLEADCWLFNACNITPLPGGANGCVVISSPMLADTATAATPALSIPLGQQINLYFKFQLTKSSVQSRKVQVFLWDLEKRIRTRIYHFAYNTDPAKQPLSVYNTSLSFQVPATSSGKFRLIFALICDGGDSQLVLDDVSLQSASGIRRLEDPGSCKGLTISSAINGLTVKPDRCNLRLTWTISPNSLASSFTVQQSTDGKEFKDIGRVAVAGSGPDQPYAYTDTEPALQNYYRIRQVDLAGKVTFSNVVEQADPCQGTHVSIEQTNTNVYTIKARSTDPGVTRIGQAQLINLQGIILKIRPVNTTAPVSFDCTYLPPGTYIIRVQNVRNYPLISQKITVY